MNKYMVLFKGIHIGSLIVSDELYSYTANTDAISKVDFPIFDVLKNDISAKEIPFFKVRIEKNCQTFETDDYELIPE